jgi:hypothetical protein
LRIKDPQIEKVSVIEQKAFRPKAWSRMHRFGYRWRVEGAFSCIKRIFGEYVSAKKFVNIAKEMAMKALIYNTFITIIKRDRIERGTSPRSKSRPTDLCNTALYQQGLNRSRRLSRSE